MYTIDYVLNLWSYQPQCSDVGTAGRGACPLLSKVLGAIVWFAPPPSPLFKAELCCIDYTFELSDNSFSTTLYPIQYYSHNRFLNILYDAKTWAHAVIEILITIWIQNDPIDVFEEKLGVIVGHLTS